MPGPDEWEDDEPVSVPGDEIELVADSKPVKVTKTSARAAANLNKQYAYSAGGLVTGPGTSTSDNISARLSPGEYVVRASAVRQPGVQQLLDRINAGGGAPVGAQAAVAGTGGAWTAASGGGGSFAGGELRITSDGTALADFLMEILADGIRRAPNKLPVQVIR